MHSDLRVQLWTSWQLFGNSLNTMGTISQGWQEIRRLMCGQPKGQKLHTNKWCNTKQ